MADINNSAGKRKTSDSEAISDVENGKDTQSIASPKETDEPVSKVIRTDEISETTAGTLSQELSQASVETNISIIEKLTELQEENTKLKRQIEELNGKMCKCTLNISGSDESDSSKQHESLIAVKFRDESVAEEYKHKFVKFLRTFIELTCTENDLSIEIVRKNGKDADLMSPSKKRKRKKSKSKSKDLFILDTTPTIRSMENTLKYVSKYLVSAENQLSEKDNSKAMLAPVCFNCDQNHALKDCPQPKNFVKINAARNKMKQTLTKTRYHLDDEQKYAHLKPGEVSSELKKALGICSNELPPYIYRMRRCGYPPGWIEDARVTHSNISLFDMDGKESSIKNSKASIDANKVIEYQGFNMPLNKGVKDDYKYYDCPPYSEQYSKGNMLNFINQKFLKEQDNLEACDMELDQSSDETMVPPGCELPPPPPPPVRKSCGRLSPSLVDLEQKKMELLAELGNNTNSNNGVVNEKTDAVQNKSIVEINNTSCVSVDDNEEERSTTQLEEAKCDDEICPTTPKIDLKKSTFGTPIVKSGSPYNCLPNPANFSKDVSPVINFENLPNATGKYEQMNSILQKIRTLKNTIDKL